MRRSQVLQAEHLYTIADFLDRPEADIEDVFDPELFSTILNETYRLEDGNTLSAEKLKTAAPMTERLVKQAEAAFAMLPVEITEFNHFAPAAWLIRNPQALDAKTDAVATTLDRAQTIFDTYNKLL